jgi:N-acetylneuraminate synthase
LAVACGASLYERHLVLENDGEAIDGPVSSTAQQLQETRVLAERARRALGHGRRECLEAEAPNRVPSRRGLYAARDLEAGARIDAHDIVSLRPEQGISAARWASVVGCRVLRDVSAGTPLQVEFLEGSGAV